MAIGRTEDRNTPGNPLGRAPRRDVWGPIRVTHLGPRSTRPHIKAGHMTAIDQTRPQLQQVLRSEGRPHKGFQMRCGTTVDQRLVRQIKIPAPDQWRAPRERSRRYC